MVELQVLKKKKSDPSALAVECGPAHSTFQLERKLGSSIKLSGLLPISIHEKRDYAFQVLAIKMSA